MLIRPNKKIGVFGVMSLKILGRVGTHIFFKFVFEEKNIILRILKGISPFIKLNFFSRKPEKKFLVTPVNLGRVRLP